MRTAQQLFDISVNGLRVQQGMSVSDSGDYCAYRGTDGRKCAVGFLIDDVIYDPQMESHGLLSLLDKRLLPTDLEEEFILHQDLLRQLQTTHDQYNYSDWEESFATIAKNFGLQYSPLERQP